MALKKLITPKNGMEQAIDREREACDALGLPTDNLDESLAEIAEENPDAYKEILKDVVKRYYLNKTEFDSYKKLVDADNAGIKEVMLGHNLEDFEVDGIVAKCTVSPRESFNEEMLMQIIKKSKVKGIIKKREYVDTDALETAIYAGTFDAAILDPAREIKEVVTLKVSRKKKKKED